MVFTERWKCHAVVVLHLDILLNIQDKKMKNSEEKAETLLYFLYFSIFKIFPKLKKKIAIIHLTNVINELCSVLSTFPNCVWPGLSHQLSLRTLTDCTVTDLSARSWL